MKADIAPSVMRLLKTVRSATISIGTGKRNSEQMTGESCEECGRINAMPVGVFRYLCFVCKELEEMDEEEDHDYLHR